MCVGCCFSLRVSSVFKVVCSLVRVGDLRVCSLLFAVVACCVFDAYSLVYEACYSLCVVVSAVRRCVLLFVDWRVLMCAVCGVLHVVTGCCCWLMFVACCRLLLCVV